MAEGEATRSQKIVNMRNFAQRLCRVAILLSLVAGSSLADELWVSNQPFQGVVTGSGQNMMVELRTFVHVLNIQADDQGEVVVIGGFPIPVQASGNVRLVPLRDVVDAAGLHITRNPELGTVDVRQASVGTGSRGNWETSSGAGDSPHREKGPITKLAGVNFSVNVPGHLNVVSDPKFLQGEETDRARKVDLNPYGSWSGNETAFMVSTDRGPTEGVLTVNLLGNVSSTMSREEEEQFFAALRSEVLSDGGKALGPVQVSTRAGKRFHQFTFRDTETDGVTYDNEVSIHFNPKAAVAFLIVLKAPQKTFQQVAPQLRLVINNLRMK